jgi:hypothetical protein
MAFMALGWLLLLGVALQQRLSSVLTFVYERFTESTAPSMQRLSDAEGKALQGLRGGGRSQELANLAPGWRSTAWLRHPPGRLLGAYDGHFPESFAAFSALESELGVRFPVIAFYQAWGDRPEHAFPERMASTIARLGSVPLLTWEPWVTEFDDRRHPTLPPRAEREFASLAAIAHGQYDFHIKPWAEHCAAHGQPLLLRFAHEMNDPYRYPWGPQNGNRPDDYLAAWRHVHQVFDQAGATNVLWVWSPHGSVPWFEYYYPGPEWVDWVGVTILNYGDRAPWSRWWSFNQIFGNPSVTLKQFGKPIVIAEFATVASGGEATAWYREAFATLNATGSPVRMLVLFNQSSDTTITTTPLNWSVTADPQLAALVRGLLGGGYAPRE